MDGEIIQIPEWGNDDMPTVFVVKGTDGEKQRFEYTGFFPIKKGDMISIGGEMSKKSSKSKSLVLKEKSLVFIPRDEKHVIKYLRDALMLTKPRGPSNGGSKGKAWGKSYPKDIGEKLYKEMIEKLGSFEKVLEYLNVGGIEFYVTVDDKELQRIYRWWNKSILRRQLYLLGLFNREIDDSGLPPGELFDKLSDNPTKVCSISMDRVFEINELFRRETPKEDINCGGILRKLVEFKKKGWFYVTEGTIKEIYPSLKKYKSYLSEEYDIIFENGRMYTRENYNLEYFVASRIAELIKIDRLGEKLPTVGGGSKVTIYGKMKLTDEQMKALKGSIRYQVSIITGGAGCGKTTLLREIVDNLENKGRRVLLSSFTGKAVMRIKEVICKGRSKEIQKRLEDQCITLSRLIHKRKTFQKTPEFDTLIIDEASMVPTGLIHSLFSFFPDPFKIILIGDCNQLDPIEAGSFFKELVEALASEGKELVKTFRLTKNMRTREGSVIVKNASKLVSEKRDFDKKFNFKEGDGLYIMDGDIEMVGKIVKGLHKAKINSDNLTILCPVNKYLPFLTMFSHRYYLKRKDKFKYKDVLYHYGDRMMQKKNFYSDDMEIMNGEEGYITRITDDFLEITYSKDKVVAYQYVSQATSSSSGGADKKKWGGGGEEGMEGTMGSLTLESITHKSQGSEYEYVIIYLPPEYFRFVSLNMLYTAITRAKKNVWIVSEKNVLDVITTQKLAKRYETLGEKLGSILNPPPSREGKGEEESDSDEGEESSSDKEEEEEED